MGLPESSGPVVFTPMGPIPLADAVQIASATAQQKALPPGSSSSGGKKPAASAKPLPGGTVPARQRSRGGAALTPAHAASEGFMPERRRGANQAGTGPAHPQASVKASLAELEALTRHLRKGREITTWEPRNLEPRVLALISEHVAKGMTPVQAADLVKTVVLPPASYQWVEKAQSPQSQAQARQQQLAQQYAQRIRAAFGAAAAAAAKLILAWGAGTLAVTAAVLAVMVADLIRNALQKALTSLWEDAWKHGEAEAGGKDPGGLSAFLATWGRQALEWVSTTLTDDIAAALHDLIGLKRKALIARLLEMLGVEERSDLIAITEIMRAWWSAVLAVWKMLGIAYKGWQTRDDAKVCFPAGTPVATPTGDVPIEQLRPGDLVLTPEGQRPVIATMERPYAGGLTVIQAEGRTVTATDNHRFMTTDGWRKAADLEAGDFLKTPENMNAEVTSIIHLALTQPDDVPSQFGEFSIADGILRGRPLVPVLTVGLNGHAETGEREVNRPAAHVKLGSEVKAQQGERLPDAELQHGLPRELAVATAGTELAIGGSRLGLRAEVCVARFAGDVDRRPSAFLGAELPVEVLLGTESLTAPPAVDVDGVGRLACVRADVVAMGDRGVDGEVVTADGATLGDLATGFVAGAGAVDLDLTFPLAGPEDDAAPGASALRVDARGRVVALVGAENPGASRALKTHDDFAALGAFVSEWHAPLPQVIAINEPLTVYNVTVDTEHVYYASRFLVHNCGECRANQAAGFIPLDAPFPSGNRAPGAHPRCRCWLIYPAPGLEAPGREQETQAGREPGRRGRPSRRGPGGC